MEPSAGVAKLSRDHAVEYVEPNFKVHADTIPNDTQYPQQWALNTALTGNINAPAAWNIKTGSASVVLAVIDSGIDYTHPDLAANIWVNPPGCAGDDTDGYLNDCHGINAITGSGDPMDDFFHGTHVAGIMGAVGNNDLGVAGVNWTVALLACKFLDSSGNGTTADAIACLDYVAQQKQLGVNIIATNNSWGSSTYSQALSDAIAAQLKLGILFITAAGNNTQDDDLTPEYPCSYDHSNVICVAASMDDLSDFSDYGVGTVHLAAPGQDILSTVLNGQYDFYDGTSMATAFVTGAAGLLSAQDPTRDWRAIKNLILSGTVPATLVTLPTLTRGNLNVANSMTCQNSTVLARMRPPNFETITLAPGGSLKLEAINIKCAMPNGNVIVNVEPGGDTVTLVDDGTGNDEVAGDGLYTAVWTASAAGSYTLTFPTGDVVNVVVDPLLKSGFPAQMYIQADLGNQTPLPAATLIVGNLDGNQGQQILAPGYVAGPLYAWRSDGTAEPGWPNYDFGETVEVSLGTFASGAPSNVVAAGYYSGNLGIYTGDDTALSGWPQSTSNNYYPPPTADLSGTGIDTILSYPAYNANGTLFSATTTIPPSGQSGPLAVADLDAVGQLNFVSASYSTLYASSASGMRPGFPVSFPANFGDINANIVIGDVDGDGKPEIVVSGLQAADPDGQGPVHLQILIYNKDGVLERTLSTTTPASNELVALADLDGDGIPEIVTATGPQLYAWKGDGSLMPGFPTLVGVGQFAGPVVVGDIDGDGYPDIAFMSSGTNSTSGQLYAFDRHGVILAGFPRPILYLAGATTPAIADLEGSGHNDLIVNTTPYVGLRDSVFAYDLQGPGPYGPVEWGQYMGGADHRGYYESGKNLPSSAYLAVQAHGSGVLASSDGAISCGSTCIHLYPNGSTVQLTATAGAGASFTQWLGACAGQSNPCSVTVGSYTAASADFASQVTVSVAGSGAVTSSPAGINCPAGSCSAMFPARSLVTLTATAVSGNPFNGWGGNCSGTAATCSLVIDAANSATAQFGGLTTLSIAIAGQGGQQISSSPAGINCGSNCTAGFALGTVVKLSAAFSEDSYVENWGVAACAASASTCSITLDADTSIVVSVAPKLSMPVDVTGAGAGSVAISAASQTPAPPTKTCSSSCTYPYQPGVALTIVASPNSNSTFAGWSGACKGTSSSCTFTPGASSSVTAAFDLQSSTSGSGGGTSGHSGGGALDRWTCAILLLLVLGRLGVAYSPHQRRHDPHRVDESAAPAQKSILRGKSQLELRPAAFLDNPGLLGRDLQEHVDLEGRYLARQVRNPGDVEYLRDQSRQRCRRAACIVNTSGFGVIAIHGPLIAARNLLFSSTVRSRFAISRARSRQALASRFQTTTSPVS
jgi:hypothetical protein